MSAPPQIRALMRNKITWERFVGQDGHADAIYAAPVTLKCWIEVRSQAGDVQRRQHAGGTTMDPELDVFLDGGDVSAQEITQRDRFTFTLNGQSFKTEPDAITNQFGPDSSVWTVMVSL